MALREPTSALCRLNKILLKPTSHVDLLQFIVYSEANIALHELTTAPVRANLPLRWVRDDSLSLASCEAAPISSSSKAKMSGVALKRSKAKARLSNEVKAKAPSSA